MPQPHVIANGGWSGSYDNHMIQHAVGHGGFFTQTVEFFSYPPSNLRAKTQTGTFLMVYDCGSGNSRDPSQLLKNRVDKYVKSLLVDGHEKIDLVVISHFDTDHINGISYLASELRNSLIAVARVWVPFLDPIARLAISLTTPTNLQPLVMEPENTLREYFPDAEVETISPSSEPFQPPDRGRPREQGDLASSDAPDAQSPIITVSSPRGRGLLTVASGQEELWEVLPYTTKATSTAAQLVGPALSQALGKPSAQITLSDITRLRTNTNILSAFHGAIQKNLPKLYRSASGPKMGGSTPKNHASLCVVSGPTRPHAWCRNRRAWGAKQMQPWSIPVAPAWLGTGDAVLKTSNQVNDFVAIFTATRLAHVGIASTPHHGSHFDSGIDLWRALPQLAIATIEARNSTGSHGGHAHPHVAVLQDLKNEGITAKSVTKATQFEWFDHGYR